MFIKIKTFQLPARYCDTSHISFNFSIIHRRIESFS